MTRTCRGLLFLTALAVTLAVVLGRGATGQIVYPPALGSKSNDLPPATSAISAVVEANGGKVPATGEQLWAALGKLDRFCQLPVAFSAVRLNSGLANPRVVMTPYVTQLGRADVTSPNLAGRLFLAANMEQIPIGADPRVTSVEFISWNTARRQFDFGVIENMGGDDTPELRIVDGGRCFACHKNRGPILGDRPWSNTTHDDILRLAEARALGLTGSHLPEAGPFAQNPPAGKRFPERIDGMALATPEAKDVDFAVRLGANLRTNRDTFRLMTRTVDGRKALAVLLVAVVGPGPLDAGDRSLKQQLDATFNQSFRQFATDWVALQKEAKPSILIDADPAGLLVASGVRPNYALLLAATYRITPGVVSIPTPQTVSVPGLTGGGGSRWAAVAAPRYQQTVRQQPTLISPGAAFSAGMAFKSLSEKRAYNNLFATIGELNRYEMARSQGHHGLTSSVQPSNPRAFFKPPVKTPIRPSAVLNTVMLAETIGLTEGDRTFLSTALVEAAKTIHAPRVTTTKLAHAVFEGPEFANVLTGGPLPDRDEFKDRFVAGLEGVLKTQYSAANGLSVKRTDYASGPKYDPKAAEAKEIAVVPTTACLRCHDIRPSGKPRPFEPIPALAFDPFDKPARQVWVRTAGIKRREAVLTRLQQRLFGDSDMPPEDAPEYDRFRMKEEAAFNELKEFLKVELEKVKEN